MMKIKNSKTGEIRAEIYDDPNEIYIYDEATGKKYTLQEFQNSKKESESK